VYSEEGVGGRGDGVVRSSPTAELGKCGLRSPRGAPLPHLHLRHQASFMLGPSLSTPSVSLGPQATEKPRAGDEA
jgi:hypothetical protein